MAGDLAVLSVTVGSIYNIQNVYHHPGIKGSTRGGNGNHTLTSDSDELLRFLGGKELHL